MLELFAIKSFIACLLFNSWNSKSKVQAAVYKLHMKCFSYSEWRNAYIFIRIINNPT